MLLDIRTLGLMTMITSIVTAIAMITTYRLVPGERSLRQWVLGYAMLALGTLLVALRTVSPDWLTIVLGNGCNVLGMGFIYYGTCGFFGRPRIRGAHWVAAMLTMLACAWFTYVQPDLPMRIAFVSAMFVPFMAASGWIFWVHADADLRGAHRFTAGIFWLGAALFSLRIFAASGAQVSTNYLTTSSLAVASPYLYSILFNIWLGVTVAIGVSARLQRHLIEARDRAEAANVAKSQFLATMSHEIRTPLNGILGTAQLLAMSGNTEAEVKEFAGVINSSGKALLTLLNDILDLSKIEAGRMELRPVEFVPARLLEEVHDLMSEIARQKGLHITQQWEGESSARYLADASRLRQMLSNLVVNAIKFTSTGSVRITGCEEDCREGLARLRFVVEDTGVGIAEADRQRLFKSFSQLDGTETRRFGGSGLGLSIVRNMAEQMHGQVGVEGEPGKGSRFWFTVEAKRIEDEPVVVNLANPSEKRDTVPDEEAELNVLVVDDNLVNRMVLEALVKRCGYRFSSASDGAEAVALVRGGAVFDLIFMDVQMPVMDGCEATRLIREWEAPRGMHVPVIAVTAGAFAEDRQRCFDVGMDDFIAKPVDFDKLTAVVTKWASWQRAWIGKT